MNSIFKTKQTEVKQCASPGKIIAKEQMQLRRISKTYYRNKQLIVIPAMCVQRRKLETQNFIMKLTLLNQIFS